MLVHCDSRRETEGGKLILLIYHKQMKTEQWWQDVESCSDMLSQYSVWQREFNFLSATCMSTITVGFHKGNRAKESDKPADKRGMFL